ncbi:hypothetical protein EJB05_42706, partial [Eragrostis curvula]
MARAGAGREELGRNRPRGKEELGRAIRRKKRGEFAGWAGEKKREFGPKGKRFDLFLEFEFEKISNSNKDKIQTKFNLFSEFYFGKFMEVSSTVYNSEWYKSTDNKYNLTISATATSVLPPMLNAVEIYTLLAFICTATYPKDCELSSLPPSSEFILEGKDTKVGRPSDVVHYEGMVGGTIGMGPYLGWLWDEGRPEVVRMYGYGVGVGGGKSNIYRCFLMRKDREISSTENNVLQQ